MKTGTLRIFKYNNKNKVPYYICYYEDKFRFVHISNRCIDRLIVKQNNKGKKYLLYYGDFNINEYDEIVII